MVKVLAVNDETDTCECCGKTNLKRVAVLQLEDGSIVRYGRDCAARKLGKSVAKDIDAITEIKTYIAKWEQKYSGEIVARGLGNKLGYMAEYKNGQYNVMGFGVIS